MSSALNFSENFLDTDFQNIVVGPHVYHAKFVSTYLLSPWWRVLSSDHDSFMILAYCEISIVFFVGPKAVTQVRSGDFSHLDVKNNGENVENIWNNIHAQNLTNRAHDFNLRLQGNAAVRDLSWSPVGFSPSGGCILVTVSDDHRVSP